MYTVSVTGSSNERTIFLVKFFDIVTLSSIAKYKSEGGSYSGARPACFPTSITAPSSPCNNTPSTVVLVASLRYVPVSLDSLSCAAPVALSGSRER